MPKLGQRTTYRYSRDFKATAVRLSHLPSLAVSDVGRIALHPCFHAVSLTQTSVRGIDHGQGCDGGQNGDGFDDLAISLTFRRTGRSLPTRGAPL